ncbi:MAG: glycosyltransferase family 4 protein [Negativibacillus sp.]|nr:glycosyltransferase family 4 protein [Negativibacillus sp.]
MRLLISAYACRPDMGSEPAVGWNWILEYSKLCELVVLTNFTNKPYIEEYLNSHKSEFKQVRFIYVKPNLKVELWYKEWERLERFYYICWQHAAFRIAKKICEKEKFDYVQHITYVSCVMPTYMYKLNVPFIYGPISGGEKVPDIIHYPFGKKEKLIENIRKCSQLIANRSFHLKKCCQKAKLIIAVTEESKNMLPIKHQEKTIVLQAIGLNKSEILCKDKCFTNLKVRFLIAGRMVAWKGFKIGIEAFIKALENGAEAELTVLGTGDSKMKNMLKSIAGDYLNQGIYFVDSVRYDKMSEFYDEHDILLNCSLRDSGCLVVMEAMGRGLPIICIDTGGPKVNTENGGAIKVKPVHYEELRDRLVESIILLSQDYEKKLNLSCEAQKIADEEFEYESKIASFYYKYLEKR